jgi:ribosomal protein S27E
MEGFTIKCNKCGAEVIIEGETTDGSTIEGDVKISVRAIGYGGETGLYVKCTKCENEASAEEY